MSEADETLRSLRRAVGRAVSRSEWRGLARVGLPGSIEDAQPAPAAVEEPKLAPAAPASRASTPTQAPQQPVSEPQAAPNPPESRDPAATQLSLAQAAPDLETLRTTVAACRACGLCETRQQTVFMDGSPSARVLFVGEAPGADEDAQGVPFVGKAGQLLTDIITKGMGMERSEVAIANVLKCRPPGNRDPEPAEKALCTPFLDRQIELIDPEVIVTLGRHASNHLLGRQDTMGRLRGQVHDWNGRKVVPTYHPSYLLRSPGDKKLAWEDIQRAMALLGLGT